MKSICFQLQLFLLVFFTAFLGCSSAFAEETGKQHNLFQSFALQHATSSVDASSSNAAAPEFAAIATKAAAVSINADFFKASRTMRPGDTILMDLFDGEQVVLEIQAVETDINHVTALRGNVKGSAWDFFYISIDGDKMLLTFDNPSNKRKLEVVLNRQTGAHTLYEIPQERVKVPEDLPPIVPPASSKKLSAEIVTASTPDPNEEVTVDVMVVYTPAAKQWADSNGGGIDNVISQAMTRGQQALDNSNTMLNVRLVHSAEVSYTESGSSDTDLDRLQNTSDGYMDDVHTWRNVYGADIVTLLALVEDTGGLGFSLKSSDGFPDYAFHLARVQQAGWTCTVIHELGHNMGAGHHKNQIDTPDGKEGQPRPQLYSYSAGWRWTGSDSNRYCSVMTYEDGKYFSDGQTHSQVPYFSNPNISYLGAATGSADDGDNARTLRETKHLTAKYRSSPAERALHTAAGGYHTVFIRSDGSLWAWGLNRSGQLGDATTANKNSPVRIGTDSNWMAIAAGREHTVAVKTDGSLWAWGYNANGQLGDGTTENKLTPTRIGTDSDWLVVAAGREHSVAVKTNGSLWTWGYNVNGQLGNGTTESRNSPVRIGADSNWMAVAGGGFHTLAVKTDGSLWACGNNLYGQLGDGTTENKSTLTRSGTASNWKAVTAGTYHTAAVNTDGYLWAWGNNYYGQLGDGTTTDKTSPMQIGAGNNFQAVAAGSFHVVSLNNNGNIISCGNNLHGQIGDGTTEHRHSPVQIGADSDWQTISAGIFHTVAMKKDGNLWAWGYNVNGQLGDGTTTGRQTPVPVIFLSSNDTDKDGIDDGWEMTYFHNLTIANATSDYDKDGYSDKQEYLNWQSHEAASDGAVYDPTAKNLPGGTGYVTPVPIALPAIYKLLLKR